MTLSDVKPEVQNRPRCSLHQLAVADDGMCVLCRRQKATTLRQQPKPNYISIFLITIVISTGAYGVFRYRSTHRDRLKNDVVKSQNPEALVGSLSVSTHSADAGNARVVEVRQRPLASLVPVNQPDARPPLDLPTVHMAQDMYVDHLAVVNAVHPPSPLPSIERQKQELQEAISLVSITMYVTHWCPVCVKARQWLQERGIRYTEVDVESSDNGRDKHRRLNPRGSVPTLEIEGQVLIGFSAVKVQRAIIQAAQRKLEEM